MIKFLSNQLVFFLLICTLKSTKEKEENKERSCQNIFLREGEFYSILLKQNSYFQVKNQSMLSLRQNFTYSQNAEIVDIILFEEKNNSQICSLEITNSSANYIINCNYQFNNELIDNQLVFIQTERIFELNFRNGEICFKLFQLMSELYILCQNSNQILVFSLAFMKTNLKYSYNISEVQKLCNSALLEISTNTLLIISNCSDWRIIILKKFDKQIIIDQQYILQQLGNQFQNQTKFLIAYQYCYEQDSLKQSIIQHKLYISFISSDMIVIFGDSLPIIQLSNVKSYSQVKYNFNPNCRFLNKLFTITASSPNYLSLSLICNATFLLRSDSKIMILDDKQAVIYNNDYIQLIQLERLLETFNYSSSFLLHIRGFNYLLGIDNQLNLLSFKVISYVSHFGIINNASSLRVSLNYERYCRAIFFNDYCFHRFKNNSEIINDTIQQIVKFKTIEIEKVDQQFLSNLQRSDLFEEINVLQNCFYSLTGSLIYQFTNIQPLSSICKIDEIKYLQQITYLNVFSVLQNYYLIFQGHNYSVIFYHCSNSTIYQFQLNANLSLNTIKTHEFWEIVIISKQTFFQFIIHEGQVILQYQYQFESLIRSFTITFQGIFFVLENKIKQILWNGNQYQQYTVFSETFDIQKIEQILVNFNILLQYEDYIQVVDTPQEWRSLKMNIEAEIIRVILLKPEDQNTIAKIILVHKKKNAIYQYLKDQNELIFINEFPLLHFTLIRPLEYASRNSYFAIAVTDTFNNSLAVVIYNINLETSRSIHSIIYIGKLIFGFINHESFFYSSNSGNIEIIHLNLFYIKGKTQELKSLVEKTYISINCSSFLFKNYFKQARVQVRIINKFQQLQLTQGNQISYDVPSNATTIDFQRLQHYLAIYGPINSLAISNTSDFHLTEPLYRTSGDCLCHQIMNNLCRSYNNMLILLSDERFRCQLPSDIEHSIELMVRINKTAKVLIVEQLLSKEAALYLIDCSQTNGTIISKKVINFQQEDNSLNYKFENDLLVITSKQILIVNSFSNIEYLLDIVQDDFVQIKTLPDFNECYFIKDSKDGKQYLMFRYNMTSNLETDQFVFILYLKQINTFIEIETYQFKVEQLELLMEAHSIQPNFGKFQILSVEYHQETGSIQIILSYLATTFNSCIFEINLYSDQQIKIFFQQILRLPLLDRPIKNEIRQWSLLRLSNEFLLLKDNEYFLYLYDISQQSTFYDYIYRFQEQISDISKYNSTHLICKFLNEIVGFHYMKLSSYQIHFKKDLLVEGKQYPLLLEAKNSVSMVQFQLVLQFPAQRQAKEELVQSIISVILIIIIVAFLIVVLNYYCKRRRLLKLLATQQQQQIAF